MKDFHSIQKQIVEDKKTMEVIPTGLFLLDDALEGGFIKKELIVLGGKTGGGKSLMAGTIFYNMASKGYKCAYFSLEISNQMVVSRLVGAKANISPTRLMIHDLAKNERKAVNDADAEIGAHNGFMHFYDDLYLYPAIEKAIVEGQYDFVVIDFIQNIQLGKQEEYERLSYVALALQKLAKRVNCIILAVSQLSNLMAKAKPSDVVEYKGSGAIGHAADLGFFIEPGKMGDNSLVLKLRKNRRGMAGHALNFTIQQPGGRIIELS